MAKAQMRGLEEELDRVFSRYKSNLKKSMQEAADEAEFEIKFEAESCLDRYYDNFQTEKNEKRGKGRPNWYDRTESLRWAFVPYNDVIEDKNNNSWVAKVGMSYDPSRLDGVYSSNASTQYQPVDGSWVLNNYLSGIHPTTNGYPLYADQLEYIEIRDPESPEDHMNAFLEKYYKTFYENVIINLARRVSRER
ncbi:MAG: hypothetical protein UH850_11290 [Paludibacteraceae bacterium]|nr:hypothetical protein [Paludibacteraceae bacterium]